MKDLNKRKSKDFKLNFPFPALKEKKVSKLINKLRNMIGKLLLLIRKDKINFDIDSYKQDDFTVICKILENYYQSKNITLYNYLFPSSYNLKRMKQLNFEEEVEIKTPSLKEIKKLISNVPQNISLLSKYSSKGLFIMVCLSVKIYKFLKSEESN